MQFKSRKGKDLRVSYPCVVLNVMVAKHNTNDQYQTLVDTQNKRYETSSRMSIEFEVDGPYKAGFLRHHPCPPSDHLRGKPYFTPHDSHNIAGVMDCRADG